LNNNNKSSFDEIKAMDQEEAIKSLNSILTTSEKWEDKVKAAEILYQYEDCGSLQFQDVKTIFLNDRHPQLRLRLIDILTKCYKKEGIKFLKGEYKGCSDGTVRRNLIERVGMVDLNNSTNFFIEALGDPNIESKELAITFLGKAGKSEALIPLIELLHLRNSEIYNYLITSIVKIGKKGNLQILNEYIESEDPNIKREIPIILGKIGNKQSEHDLINFLRDENPIIRRNAVKALEKVIEIKNLRYITDSLNDQNIEVKKETIRVLGKIESKLASKPLLEILKDNDIKIRKLAKNALFKIFSKQKSYEPLYNILKGRNLNARKETIKILGLLKDQNAIDMLIKTFDSKVASIRRSAYRALLQILNKKVNEKIKNSLSDKSWQIRMYCAKILGEIGDPNTINEVFNLIGDESGNVRNSAIDALINFNLEDKIVSKAKDSLKSSNWKIRRAAVKLLIKTGGEESIDILISCLDDNDVHIKSWAAMALGKLKNIDSIEPFIQLLKDSDSKIRISAVKALGEIGNKEVIKALIETLGDDSWEVKKETENALNLIDEDWMDYL